MSKRNGNGHAKHEGLGLGDFLKATAGAPGLLHRRDDTPSDRAAGLMAARFIEQVKSATDAASRCDVYGAILSIAGASAHFQDMADELSDKRHEAATDLLENTMRLVIADLQDCPCIEAPIPVDRKRNMRFHPSQRAWR